MSQFCDAHEAMRRYGGYVEEVRRLFASNGLGSGKLEDFAALAPRLWSSRALQSDLSALAVSVRDRERGSLSADEMLTIIALAGGGRELVDAGDTSIAISTATGTLRMLLAGLGGWNEAETPALRNSSHSSPANTNILTKDIPAISTIEPPPRQQTDSVSPPMKRENRQHGETSAESVAAEQAQGRLELALVELKLYLDDIDRRIGRLEPRLEDISEIVHTSADLMQRPWRVPIGAEEAPGIAGHIASQNPVQEAASAPPDVVEEIPPPQQVELISGSAAERLAVLKSILRPGESISAPAVAPVGDVLLPAAKPHLPLPLGGDANDGKERLRNLLNIAAGVLAMAGTVGLAILLLGPQSGQEHAAASAGVSAPRPMPSSIAGVASAPVPLEQSPAPATAAAASASGAPQRPGLPVPARGRTEPKQADAGARHPGSTLPPPQPSPDKSARTRPEAPVIARVEGERSRAIPREPAVEEPQIAGRSTTDGTGETAFGARPPQIAPVESAASRGPGTTATGEVPPIPSESRPVILPGRPLPVPPSVMQAKLISSREPVYPPEALREHLEGRVVLKAFIGKDGTVHRMDVVQGPYVFVKSALAAVSWRRYRPYLVDGKPVEVETQVTLDYPGR